MSDETKKPREDLSPDMRRAMDRRRLITDELGRAGMQAVKQLPGLAGAFGFLLKESPTQRDERLMRYLWQLLMGRNPQPKESEASLELLHAAKTPEEKGDALVDLLWALCQTKDFEDLGRSDNLLVRGLYKTALNREPTTDEREAALNVLSEATDITAKGAALEGLFSGLIRSAESVLRTPSGRR